MANRHEGNPFIFCAVVLLLSALVLAAIGSGTSEAAFWYVAIPLMALGAVCMPVGLVQRRNRKTR